MIGYFNYKIKLNERVVLVKQIKLNECVVLVKQN
jgi:hypothetical protein